MTGIIDVFRNAAHLHRRSTAWWAQLLPFVSEGLRKKLLKYVSIGFLESSQAPKLRNWLNDFRPSLPLNPKYDPAVVSANGMSETILAAAITKMVTSSCQNVDAFRWALLLPVCSRNDSAERCFSNLQKFRDTLFQTTNTCEDGNNIMIVLGVDYDDQVYDCNQSLEKLTELFAPYRMKVVKFTVGFQGRLCWIWESLARVTVQELAVDFFVLLGDDVEMRTPGWKSEIEAEFKEIANEHRLPFGFGCVAFRDLAFPVFPTFPVLHRSHLDIFGGRLFGASGCRHEDVFVNQHGDPFVFEIYRRWGASKFASHAQLCNTVGGNQVARYTKHDTRVPWRDEPLTDAISIVQSWLKAGFPGQDFHQYVCIDIVCPTFRCDPEMLKHIADLRASPNVLASTQILFIADKPDSTRLEEIKALEQWHKNSLVRVYVNAENSGASQSRNAGMAQSFADYVICLDDDVIPENQLLDAYIGAIQRHPDAKVWVGCTKLPSPQTLMQEAVIASGISYFYDIVEKMRNPPWGVTANICFRCRTQNQVWFSSAYPKTGGGEDVDYCIRLKENSWGRQRDESIVSVPGARAQHPFWSNILRQVGGWASGDVLCLELLPHNTFYTLPNWIETILLIWIYAGSQVYHTHELCVNAEFVAQASAVVVVLEFALNIFNLTLRQELLRGSSVRLVAVIALAVLPGFVQDFVRLRSKIFRLKFYQLCMWFDWLDGQSDLVVAVTWNEGFKFCLRILFLAVFFDHLKGYSRLATTIIAGCLTFWWIISRRDNFFCMPPSAEIYPLDADDEGITPHSTPKPFVVLAFQRTGSNLLCGILHNHPQIAMHNEIFAGPIHTYCKDRSSWPDGFSEDVRDIDPARFLRAAFRCFGNKVNPRAVGFKLFPEHFSNAKRNEHLLKLLQDKRLKKVILHRQDELAVQVSMLRAALTGRFLKEMLDDIIVKLPPASFQRFLGDYRATYEFYNKITSGAGQQVFRVSYEQLVTDQERVVKNLLTFLDMPNDCVPHALNETVQQSKFPAEYGISNFDQIEFAFRHEPSISLLKAPVTNANDVGI